MSNYPKPLLINGSLALLVWSGWYLLGGETAIRAMYENWPVTLTMVFGSFIAGATSEGGGPIGDDGPGRAYPPAECVDGFEAGRGHTAASAQAA